MRSLLQHYTLCWLVLSSSIGIHSSAFVVKPNQQSRFPSSLTLPTRLYSSKNDHDHHVDESESQPNDNLVQQVFPVVSQIHGINWEGYCRYVNSDLQPQTQLKLTGGTRFDLDVVEGSSPTLSSSSSDAMSSVSITITSFLVFPDGRTRQVQMKGVRQKTDHRPSIRLDPIVDGILGNGPIYMVLTEVLPDTILLNEVERESGRIILTSTLSLVPNELIQSSHEIGSRGTMPLEGHQLWRFRQRTFGQPSSTSSTTTSTMQDASTTANQGTTPSNKNSDNKNSRDDETKRSSDIGDYRGTTGR